MDIACLPHLWSKMLKNTYQFYFSPKIINNGHEFQGRQFLVAGLTKLVSTDCITGNGNLSTRTNVGQ